jgi:hypothetical protein
MDNPEKTGNMRVHKTKTKKNKKSTQYVLDTTVHKQRQMT